MFIKLDNDLRTPSRPCSHYTTKFVLQLRTSFSTFTFYDQILSICTKLWTEDIQTIFEKINYGYSSYPHLPIARQECVQEFQVVLKLHVFQFWQQLAALSGR